MRPALNLIVCFDGTSNSEYLEGNSLTNVSRLRRSISNDGYGGATRQIVHYHGGIGTGFRNPLNVLHQVVGAELERIIIRAYTFLCDNYHNTSNDRIFLIGFSRGAFAVRCLADLVHLHGVLPKGRVDDIHELYRHWSCPETHGQQPANHTIDLRIHMLVVILSSTFHIPSSRKTTSAQPNQ